MTEPFKQIQVHDVFHHDRFATFERPSETSETILITTFDIPFHLDAGTLKIIADLLAYSPSKKTIV